MGLMSMFCMAPDLFQENITGHLISNLSSRVFIKPTAFPRTYASTAYKRSRMKVWYGHLNEPSACNMFVTGAFPLPRILVVKLVRFRISTGVCIVIVFSSGNTLSPPEARCVRVSRAHNAPVQMCKVDIECRRSSVRAKLFACFFEIDRRKKSWEMRFPTSVMREKECVLRFMSVSLR